MELQGRVKMKGDIQTFGQNGFQKRELVITTEEQYPQPVSFEFVQDKVYILEPIKEGQLVKVHFNVRGREWTNPQGEVKYFNSLQGWKIENMEVQNPANASVTPPPATPESAPSTFTPEPIASSTDFSQEDTKEEEDDLPF